MHDYTVDQFNLFSRCAARRKYDDETNQIAITFNAVAAAFGSKKCATTLQKMLADRQSQVQMLQEQRTAAAPKEVGQKLFDKLRASGIPVRRRNGKGRIS